MKYYEMFYYITLLSKFFNIFIYLNCDTFRIRIIRFFLNFGNFYSLPSNQNNLNLMSTKPLSNYFKTNFFDIFYPKKTFEVSRNCLIIKRSDITNTDQINLKLFNLFFLFNYVLFDNRFSANGNFKLFYIKDFTDKIVVLDVPTFFKRWKDSYSLLFNIFWYELNLTIFGSPFFKIETLSLNWHSNAFDINFWKYFHPFFIFKSNEYGKVVDFFFEKLNQHNKGFFIISDCFYHFKNAHYLKKKNYYTIGLVDVRTDPWLVTYPIVSFFESFVTQLFFLKLLVFIHRQALLLRYNLFKNIWTVFSTTISLNKFKKSELIKF